MTSLPLGVNNPNRTGPSGETKSKRALDGAAGDSVRAGAVSSPDGNIRGGVYVPPRLRGLFSPLPTNTERFFSANLRGDIGRVGVDRAGRMRLAKDAGEPGRIRLVVELPEVIAVGPNIALQPLSSVEKSDIDFDLRLLFDASSQSDTLSPTASSSNSDSATWDNRLLRSASSARSFSTLRSFITQLTI